MATPFKKNERDAIPALTKLELRVLLYLKNTDITFCYGAAIADNANVAPSAIYATLIRMQMKGFISEKSISVKQGTKNFTVKYRVYFVNKIGKIVLEYYKKLQDAREK